MKRTLLFGAGQCGAMCARLLASDYQAAAFADNDESRQGDTLLGLPVLSLADALKLAPACVFLCVTDRMRANDMERQLRALGYAGEVLRAADFAAYDVRKAVMQLFASQLEARRVVGDIAELGVYRGDFAALLNAAFPSRTLHLFDTFAGFPEEDACADRKSGFSSARESDFSETTLEAVLSRMPHAHNVQPHVGVFPESFAPCRKTRFAFVSIDADLYAPTAAALPLFWERLSIGGALLIHDYQSAQYAGAGKAVQAFCEKESLYPLPLCDLHGSAILLKQGR